MMFRQLKRYCSINGTERKILNRSFYWLIYAFILVRIIPLRWFSSLLGEFNTEAEVELNDDQFQLIGVIKKNIRRVKKRVPWKVKCFEEAIAFKRVLKKFKIDSTLYLGVDKKRESQLIAHAWLKCGNTFLTGERGSENYTVVGFYT